MDRSQAYEALKNTSWIGRAALKTLGTVRQGNRNPFWGDSIYTVLSIEWINEHPYLHITFSSGDVLIARADEVLGDRSISDAQGSHAGDGIAE